MITKRLRYDSLHDYIGYDPAVAEWINIISEKWCAPENFYENKVQTTDLVLARYVLCFIFKTLRPRLSLAQIGIFIGKDHATIIHGKKDIDKRIATEKGFADRLQDTLALCRGVSSDYSNKIRRFDMGIAVIDDFLTTGKFDCKFEGELGHMMYGVALSKYLWFDDKTAADLVLYYRAREIELSFKYGNCNNIYEPMIVFSETNFI